MKTYEASAVATMRAAGFESLEDYPGSIAPWRCRCTACGKESSPALGNVRAGSKCRHCGVWRARLSDDDFVRARDLYEARLPNGIRMRTLSQVASIIGTSQATLYRKLKMLHASQNASTKVGLSEAGD